MMPTSLISIVAAMALVGLMALMAEPSLSSTERNRHNTTVRQIEYLIELARDRSAKTETIHGVRWDVSTRTFDVIQADVTQFPVVILGTASDPVTKQPARVVLSDAMLLAPAAPFTFSMLGAQSTLFFDRWGTPVNVQTGGSFVQLSTGQINLTADGWGGWINVLPVSGRVQTSGS